MTKAARAREHFVDAAKSCGHGKGQNLCLRRGAATFAASLLKESVLPKIAWALTPLMPKEDVPAHQSFVQHNIVVSSL